MTTLRTDCSVSGVSIQADFSEVTLASDIENDKYTIFFRCPLHDCVEVSEATPRGGRLMKAAGVTVIYTHEALEWSGEMPTIDAFGRQLGRDDYDIVEAARQNL